MTVITHLGHLQHNYTFVDDEEPIGLFIQLVQLQASIDVNEHLLNMLGTTKKKSVLLYETVRATGGLVDPPQEICGTSTFDRQMLIHFYATPIGMCCAKSQDS